MNTIQLELSERDFFGGENKDLLRQGLNAKKEKVGLTEHIIN